MGFFSGIGSSAAALGQKLGQVGDFALDLAPKLTGIYQTVQQIKLLRNGQPPRSDVGNVTAPGEIPPPGPVAEVDRGSSMSAALPLLLVGGLAVALFAAKGAK